VGLFKLGSFLLNQSIMVSFEITPRIKSSLKLVLENEERLPKEDLNNFKKYESGEEKSIPFAIVLKLAEHLQKRQQNSNNSPTTSKKKERKVRRNQLFS